MQRKACQFSDHEERELLEYGPVYIRLNEINYIILCKYAN